MEKHLSSQVFVILHRNEIPPSRSKDQRFADNPASQEIRYRLSQTGRPNYLIAAELGVSRTTLQRALNGTTSDKTIRRVLNHLR